MPDARMLSALLSPSQDTQQAGARSKYLAAVLKDMQESGKQIRGGWGELGARLGGVALAQMAQNRNDTALLAAQEADRERYAALVQQKAAALFPDDARAQAAFSLAPEAMIGAVAKGYEPQQVAAGNTLRVQGQADFMAPKYGVDGGHAYGIGPDGFQWGAQRPQSHAEVEAARHNQIGEQQGWRGLDISQQNANTSAFSAQTGRMSFEERRRQGGFGTPGVGGVIGPALDPNEWEIVGNAAGR